jgi:thiamine transporter
MQQIAEKLSGFFGGLDAWIGIAVTVVGLAILVFLLVKAAKNKWNAGIIAEVGIAAALSLTLSLFPIWRMPQGGSITLSMLPVLVVAFRRGVVPGLVCGLIAGLFQSIADPYIVSLPQFILDYGLSYTVLGFAGVRLGNEEGRTPGAIIISVYTGIIILSAWLFIDAAKIPANAEAPGPNPLLYLMIAAVAILMVLAVVAFGKKVAGKIALATAGIIGRLAVHFLSGAIFFAQYAWQGYNSYVYSLAYNMLYIIPSAFLCFVVLVPLMKSGVVARVE